MDSIILTEKEITKSLFNGIVYAVWCTYDYQDDFAFLHKDGTMYSSRHYQKLHTIFQVIDNVDWSKRSWKDWTYYYMGMGGGVVFVHKKILEYYKKYAGIVDNCIEHFPNFEAALKALGDYKLKKFSFRERNQTVARETLQIIEQEFYIKDDRRIDLVSEKFDKTIVILPEDIEIFSKMLLTSSDDEFPKIQVSTEDSYAAARKLQNCLVMNFASATSPGGGFLSGANAQEENLCRESTLYKSLSSEKAEIMYDYNNLHRNPCKYNAMILSPNVCVFRDIKDELLDEPFQVSVITIPALNKNGGAKNIPQEKIDEVMKKRLKNMFITAAHFGYKNLILGAWGCGAFGNDPEIVAKYFYEVLIEEKFASCFEKIVFAILDRGEKKNFTAFQKVFEVESDSKDNSDTFKRFVMNMESAINKFELRENIAVFRWANPSMLNFFEKLKDSGEYFQDDGFVSTTAVVPKPVDNLIEVKIIVPAGMGKGAYIAPLSDFPKEAEFVLQRGTIFKVLEIIQKENANWQVTVGVVGCKPKVLD